MPDPASATDAQWAAYVFNRHSVPRVAREWWYHVASGTWFIAERDVASDTVRATWLPAEAPPEPGAGIAGGGR
jgi:sarcosine oxidase subunit delta